MKLTIRRVKLDCMGYEASGYAKGRYWGVGDRLYYCPELDEVRSETSIRECNEPHARAPDLAAARRVFTRRMEQSAALPRRAQVTP